MPKQLTQHQITEFYEQGFLSPIDLLSEQEAAECLEKLEFAERQYPDAINAENRNNAHLALTCLDALVHHPILLEVVEDLIGPDFALYGSVLFIKEPQTGHFVSWHQDATYNGLWPHDYITPWVALTPSTMETGCMSMLPGSHKRAIQPHLETFHEDNILTRGQEIQDIDPTKTINLELRPGQMSIHHAKVIHGSRPNRSQQRRVGFAMQSFAANGCEQELGQNIWLPMRGKFEAPELIPSKRPSHDMSPSAVLERRKANDNWSHILYHGAKQKRSY